MKYQKELIERMSKAMGRDVSDVINELFAIGVLDEGLARRGCVMQSYLLEAPDTTRSTTSILSEIAEQYHMCEKTAWNVVNRAGRV